RVAVFPELGLTGYTCADLFYQPALRHAAGKAARELAATAHELGMIAFVGLPVEAAGRLYNCAAVLAEGRVWGLTPKSYLPNSGEYYERRWFSPAATLDTDQADVAGQWAWISTKHILGVRGPHPFALGVEICEDLWAVQPPSGRQALAGATVLVNLSASNELLGKADYRRELVKQQSARCLAAYLYAAAGPGESSTDLVFSGHGVIAENGAVLAETERFSFATRVAMADLDLERLTLERIKNSSFAAERPATDQIVGEAWIELPIAPKRKNKIDSRLLRPNPPRPFVPDDAPQRAARCEEIFQIQATGLATRLRHTGSRTITIGISGGLDSTLALLVAARAFDKLGLDRRGILGVTMPGPGTTQRTRNNAEKLVGLLGATLRVVPIAKAVAQHFADIGQSPTKYDITYENSQARERTQILMDLANQHGGLVVGTGDLSEFALGWCTFNGDHMSMYHVNAGVPKTLVRHLIEWCADGVFEGAAAAVLRDIAETPVSPELLPPGKRGELRQKTEESIGPYDLHDFFLFHTVRVPSRPAKVLLLAEQAWAGQYSRAEIAHWLEVFYRRFFANQFKRSSMPDGPKVGSVALSPRGDWRMPSDARPDVWLTELAAAVGKIKSSHKKRK
ncbi:MAG TPA: NAD(+) synthase, partial [Opitutales bacterium]|nr:NAD(+) synthase [Opitutales bacterium]